MGLENPLSYLLIALFYSHGVRIGPLLMAALLFVAIALVRYLPAGRGPAYAVFEEKDKGSIEVGKLADFTVLSQDIMKIPEMEILETQNEMTVIGGDIIFSR